MWNKQPANNYIHSDVQHSTWRQWLPVWNCGDMKHDLVLPFPSSEHVRCRCSTESDNSMLLWFIAHWYPRIACSIHRPATINTTPTAKTQTVVTNGTYITTCDTRRYSRNIQSFCWLASNTFPTTASPCEGETTFELNYSMFFKLRTNATTSVITVWPIIVKIPEGLYQDGEGRENSRIWNKSEIRQRLCTVYVPPCLTFSNSTFCPHSVFMCFVWISEQTAIISLYSINWLVFITETECVYCAVRTGCLYIVHVCFSYFED